MTTGPLTPALEVAAGGMIAALYIARREKRALLYAGKVGTGFTHDQSRMMRQKLEKLVTDNSAISKLKKPKAQWVTIGAIWSGKIPGNGGRLPA